MNQAAFDELKHLLLAENDLDDKRVNKQLAGILIDLLAQVVGDFHRIADALETVGVEMAASRFK